MAMLRAIYGASVEKLKVEHKNWKVRSTKVDITTIASIHHIELCPSDVGNHDRFVIQEVLKEIAASVPFDQKLFKVVVIKDVDRLSKGAQHALRKTMEKYMATCRLVLYCNSTSKVIDPVRSRCLLVRVPAPTHQEIAAVLNTIARKESFQLPEPLALAIAQSSQRNLRKAILQLEATKTAHYPFQPASSSSSNQQQDIDAYQGLIVRADWEQFIVEIAEAMLQEQSAKQLLNIRSKLYELLCNCIPPDVILQHITLNILKKVDSTIKHELLDYAAHYGHRLQTGSKPIFHLEAFVARFMALYRRFLIQLGCF
eukprot:CAMPEP_0201544492 /NCGR_PEP_ID=MMETSP0173_2-20130828/1113_1 /ASSEMBLY_ACC=CAM_ASM_000268 /TAXON_ID=218659 /ORGANISM="Vexillifera sp., Strain DIVA3 564/2" /LENGTH=312 /DNA_ID=CAMNT_0047952631 /DNA_START=66 /DNA_END=1004 /DNA_ORIENTATION=-